ncbi:hypothetical protein O181_095889 [Austropuccinia psidii MF-1]|uniref:Reverse transcriptase Ty1/copia-type domain-containing protein n=1 Tax=Austropuccinia psidii MF-1 TaxID=1389203 RepID=A0A9Q3PC69_9BASI|nr:hypothetical protein [Austropuccinia psidii MF-1]
MFHGCIVLWKTWKQPTVSLSKAKAEYKALSDLTSEILWLWKWAQEFPVFHSVTPILVYEDNQSCINAANGECNINNKHMKHGDIQLHFIKEAIQSSIIQINYNPASSMLANFLIKAVSRPALCRALAALGFLRLGVRGDVENHLNTDQNN